MGYSGYRMFKGFWGFMEGFKDSQAPPGLLKGSRLVSEREGQKEKRRELRGERKIN